MPRSLRLAALAGGLLLPGARAMAQATAPLPARPEILDTAALRAALAARPPLADARRAARMLAVYYDTAGAPMKVEPVVPELMPAPQRDTLVALVRAHLRPIAPRGITYRTSLLLDTGPSARVEERAPEMRPAAVANLPRLQRELERAARELMNAENTLDGTELRVRLRLRISADGRVESAEITESSGKASVDGAAVRLVQATRFVPQQVEGEPVAATVVLPLRFVFEG